MKVDDLQKAADLANRAKSCRQLLGTINTGPMQITVAGLTLTVAETDNLRHVLNAAVENFASRSLKQAEQDMQSLGVDVQPSPSEITGFEEDV